MPTYQYIEVETGKEVEFNVPIQRRDQVKGCNRVQIPRRLNVLGGAPDPTGPDQAVPRALRQLEEKMGHKEIAKQSGWSTSQLKDIWNIK